MQTIIDWFLVKIKAWASALKTKLKKSLHEDDRRINKDGIR